jgi:HAMP domain-containing protein
LQAKGWSVVRNAIAGEEKGMGIRARFILVAGVLAAVAMLVVGIASYRFSMGNAMTEAKEKGQIIFTYITSSNNYFNERQGPLITKLMEGDRFYPELMTTFAITRGIYERFAAKMPAFRFKQATLNPLQPTNKADAGETEIIARFQKDQALADLDGTLDKDGEEFYYIAKPVRVEDKDCLRCHGDPYKAPKDQTEIYGVETGYNWQMGETVGAMVIYIPLKQALAAARSSALTLFLIGAGCMLVALLGIWFFLDKAVVGPIVHLCDRAEEISVGKNLDEAIKANTQDEIGSLNRAVERLRVSMVRMLKRQK